MQLSQEQEQEQETFDNIGQFHHRNESPHTTKPLVGDISISDIFIKSKEHVNALYANNQYYSEDRKIKDVDNCANMVGVIGQAGIGKTSLTKTLLQKIIDDGLFETSYVFYLQFRELDYDKETNLLSFLAKSLSFSWVNNSFRRNAVIKELCSRNDVIVIMDGFDEAVIDASASIFPKITVYDLAKPEIFLKNILKGNILENTKKILTSRPRQLLEISTELRPKYLVNILGLALEAQYQICENICGDIANDVFNYIQQHPSIASYCYVPCTCILAMHAVNTIKKQQKKNEQRFPMPSTISGILTIVLCLFISSPHVRENRSAFALKKLAYLAWDGFINRKFCFTEIDLRNAGLRKDEVSLFFTTKLAKNTLSLVGGSPSKIFYFSHLIIQEFLAALYLIFFTELKTFEKLVMGTYRFAGMMQKTAPEFDITEGNWEMVTKFMFGICNSDTQNKLQHSFSDLSKTVFGKTDLLCDFALRKLPNQILTPDNVYFQNVLPVCIWSHEMNDIQLAVAVAKKLKKNIVIRGKVLPSDISSFNYIFLQRKTALNLDCTQYETWFVGDSINHFMTAMDHHSTISRNITVIFFTCLRYSINGTKLRMCAELRILDLYFNPGSKVLISSPGVNTDLRKCINFFS